MMVDEKEPTGKKSNVTEEEIEATFELAAPYCNKIYLTVHPPSLVRLTFAEVTTGGEPIMRTAVSLSLNDLTKLRDLVDRTLKNTEFVHLPPKGQ